MKKASLIAGKAYDFGLKIIKLTKVLTRSYENIVIIKQIHRCATSIGANIEEALGLNSKREFIHSMNIAKKEARETLYWLKLLLECNPVASKEIQMLLKECEELIKILTSIVKSSSESITQHS